MDFTFTEEQEAIRDTARRFARERVLPGYRAREETKLLERDLVREAGELGLLGADLAEEAGGLGLGSVIGGVITEEVAWADFSFAYVPLLASLNGHILATFGSDLGQEVAREMCAGRRLCALGLTEPRGGSDAAHLITRARREGNGYVLNGEKASISLANQADDIIVFARTSEDDAGAHGVSAFLVDMKTPGISHSLYDNVGSMGAGRGSVFFEDVRVEGDRLLGEEGQGFRQVMAGFDYSRALIALQCLAPARASLDEAWDYIQQREAFGKPLAKFQGVTEPLAEAETLLQAATLLSYKTLWLRDRGLPHTGEAAMVKWWGPKVAFEAVHSSLLIHGHLAYTGDLPHAQRLRDIMGMQIGDGTAQIQKMIVAREKIGRIAVPY